jgi:hypothetical protein
VSDPLRREQALRVLALASTADAAEVKRAYRRLAREHHPDHGGDPEHFHELQQAFECLLDTDAEPRPPSVARGRPSRPRAPAPDAADTADQSSIDWTVPAPATGTRLSRDLLASALLAPEGTAVNEVTATSHSPGSRLNAVAPHLAGNMTCTLHLFPDRDDRGRPVLTIELRGWNRRSRRALQQAALLGHWTRIRGSSSILLRSSLTPGADPRSTIVRSVDRTDALLDGLDWPLPAWTLTTGTS